ncbi:DUF1674 domain-containing protein [Alteriqipengyuania lutimaris]|uniref:DUF1674 domain-containing protein n=1 Tax=Alteriqipengyuania lutimaris TaxID=1538146 RepID=A0A395LJW2_9SPHN|nr:DUF1674 domain-containing protein [Alteriqipengyuania lutimaris]RDS77263.1 DUF1674 domain-containing protein [Alteriqipengyuania lutimaris]
MLETPVREDHLGHMKRATERPEDFKKPAHWSDDPPPAPEPIDASVEDPKGLSPTRYGDWVKDGIAIDF